MYILSADCIEVRGYQRSAICDLRRQAYYEGPYIEDINRLDPDYLKFLYQNEIVIDIPEEVADAFLPINLEYKNYSFITNAIVAYSVHLNKTMDVLEYLSCYNFAVTIYKPIPVEKIDEFLKNTYNRNFNSIELHFYAIEDQNNYLRDLNELFQKYSYINPYLYIQTTSSLNNIKKLVSNRFLVKPTWLYDNQYVTMDSFYCNIELFVESQMHNTYYNRKLFIDEQGNISNTRNGNVFANVFEVKTKNDIIGIIDSKEFQYLWKVSKDKIDVCKDCEYRHLCIDSRIPNQRKDGTWYHKTECNYNPYICMWKNEEGFIDLAISGITLTSKSFSVNREQLRNTLERIYND